MPHRSHAPESLAQMTPRRGSQTQKVSDYFGCNVFGPETMRLLLPKDTYRRLREAVDLGKRIEPEVANAVAAAMKTWALSKGATHYCHWFQPMTGYTAEKHDSFVEPTGDGRAIEKFSGRHLVQAEPDASSFPSGGLRVTFEARGYTAWDPTSPAFIMEMKGGATLCIPTIFVSYNGQSLDDKTPLLRSCDVISKAALDILKLFKSDAAKVHATLGAEQEYFLVDRSYYESRPDLLMAGRTLVGAPSPKGQQLEDHYFGSIKERVFAFMNEAESELYKLGVPVKTRHNEVAPNQFESAPVFEEVNVAVDHNQLVMDVLDRIAIRHGLAVLLHEKPFAGINGSGKHCNWSLATDTGKNLLTPGDTPNENLQFVVFLACIVKAVHDNPLFLRATVASAGNDHRLGANEAPPAIMSVFLGGHLTKVFADIEKGVHPKGQDKEWMSFGLSRIPPILRDNTDRNRTSPFAFTGDKFEFRAVGSSFNTALPITILHAIVAAQLRQAKTDIEAKLKKKPFKDAVLEVLRGYIKQSKAICFEGNNYSAAWVKEAAKRGLPNVQTTPDALEGFSRRENGALLERLGIMSAEESLSREHVKLEKYAKDIEIEARLLMEMVETQIVPAGLQYQNRVAEAVRGLRELLPSEAALDTQIGLLRNVADHIDRASKGVTELRLAVARAVDEEDGAPRARFYCHKVKPLFTPIREAVDGLEGLVDAELWPLPKYREMLFLL
ncbi:MAG: glutamine synthetase III [Elusimicrobia bacterium]|nr:glutamine synthetase III [Elusimicrobiota bacterium]